MDDLDSPNPPRKGDLLFRDDLSDWSSNACINPTWGDDQGGYTEGYRRGAHRLVQHVVETRTDQDFLVYPIIFLYRHHIELALKNIIMRAACLIKHPLTDAEKMHLGRHRLDWLWQDLKPMLPAVCELAGWNRLDSADVEGIDDYIRQLSAMDPDSFSFRYVRSKKGDPSLPPELERINLRHFAEMIERLADYLDAIDAATVHLEEFKSEMEAEWRREMASYMEFA